MPKQSSNVPVKKSAAFAVNYGDGLVALSSIWLRIEVLKSADRAFLNGG